MTAVTTAAPRPDGTPPVSSKLVNLPNGLTVLRLAMVPLFAVLLLQNSGSDQAGRYWATLVFVLAIITDPIDGMIARRTGQVTEFGKLADPIADKALIGTALIGLSVLDLLPWWVTGLILAREVGVTLLRFWVIRH
ncbi:MAG: CDP-alcohol phosphatidyltransferase family protein, partial [Actinomycetes bacterium]